MQLNFMVKTVCHGFCTYQYLFSTKFFYCSSIFKLKILFIHSILKGNEECIMLNCNIIFTFYRLDVNSLHVVFAAIRVLKSLIKIQK